MADREVRVKIVADTSDITKKLSNLEKELKDLVSTIDKADGSDIFDKSTKGATEFKDTLKDVDKVIDNLDDSMDEVDKNDFNNLTKTSNKLKELFSDLGKKLDTDGIAKKFTEIKNSFSDLGNKLNVDTIAKKFTEIKDSMKELGGSVLNKVSEKFKSIFDGTKEGTTIFSRLKEIISKISGKFGDFGNKIKNSFSSVVKGGDGVVGTISSMITAWNTQEDAITKTGKKMNTYTAQLEALRQQKMNIQRDIQQVTREMSRLEEVMNNGTATERQKKRYEELGQELEQYKKLLRDVNKATNEVSKQLSVSTGEMQKLGNKHKDLNKTIKVSTQTQEDLANASKEATQSMSQQANEVGGIASKFESLKEAFSSIKDAFGKFKSGDIQGGFSGLVTAFNKIKSSGVGVVAGIMAVVTALDKLYEAGKRNFLEGVSKINTQLQPIVNFAKSIGNELKNAFENITGTQLDLSTAIEEAVEFESVMASVGAICGASGNELQVLSNVAREWGAKTRYSANQVAEAMTYMGMAGWNSQEIMAGLEGVLNLATIGCVDLGQASDFVTDGLTALGMSANQSNDFVDMLGATITRSNTGVEQMQSAFTNVAPIAGTLGISMSDLSVALGLMANQGVKAEKAGTALKNLLTNMSAPTEAMTKCIQKYNLETAQKLIQDGKLIEGIQEMQKQIGHLTASEKTAIITTIAGKEALSGVSALMKSSHSEIMSLKFAVDSSTKSGRMYAESLGLIDKEGNVLIKDFNNMTDAQKKAYEQWQNFNSIMSECTDVMTLVGGSTTDLGAIIEKLGADGKVTADNVNELLNVFDKLGDGSEKTSKALKDYGIEIAYAEDGSIDFSETLKNVGAVWDTLTDAQKKNLLAQLGCSESIDEMNELYDDNGQKIEELVDAYEKAKGVSQHLAESFDATLKGSILNLSSAISERLLQVFDKIKPTVQGVINTITEFFNIWNGMSDKFKDLKGFGDAIEWLKKQSEDWGEAIKNGLSNAIKSIDEFVNGKSFDNVLQIGTNIIQGICDGILKAKEDGTLDSAISGFIKKICDWIDENTDGLVEAGDAIIDGISKGIEENGEGLNTACDNIYRVINSWVKGNEGLIGELGATVAGALIKGCVAGIGKGIANLFRASDQMIGNLLVYLVQGAGKLLAKGIEIGVDIVNGIGEGIYKAVDGIGQAISWCVEQIKTFFCNLLGINSPSTVMKDLVGVNIITGIAEGLLEGIDTIMEAVGQVVDAIIEGFKNVWDKIFGKEDENAELVNIDTEKLRENKKALEELGTTATKVQGQVREAFVSMSNIAKNQCTNIQNAIRTSFVGVANIIRNQMVNCSNIVRNQFVNMTNICRNQMVNCSNIIRNQATTWSNIIRNQMVNCANICRNQFVSMANVARNQMVNVSNIIRNQATSWSNIIRNQITNARNAFTTQMISMASVARTQMVNVSNIVRNQAVTWANIVRNQAQNMRNAFTQQMMSMSAVARNQMANVYSVIVSYMNKIRSATSRQMTMNFKVNKTVTTTNVTKNVESGMRATMSSMSSNMARVSSPSVMSTGMSSGGMTINNNGISGNLALEVPLFLDGKEIARATATYNEAELAKLAKRKSRKRGE